MFEIVCVTDRALAKEDFLARLNKIALAKPNAIILREKDLPEDRYRELAIKAREICDRNGVRIILHSFLNVAQDLKLPVHLPMPVLRNMEKNFASLTIGASCHSVSEAIEAQNRGCDYITVGHIYETDCKKGLRGRGIEFLKSVIKAVTIPVYAIGGIDKSNISEIVKSGARGACVRSGAFVCDDVNRYFYNLKENCSF